MTGPTTQTVRAFLTANIAQLIEAFDDHDPGLETWRSPVIYRCRCEFRGTREEWEAHLAERIARRFDNHEELTLL